MAEIVAGVGVPHTPTFPSTVRRGDPDDETAQHFSRIERMLDETRPDMLLMFDSDHLNSFFLDNMPQLSIGVAASTSGPNDGTPALPAAKLAVPHALAEHVRNACVESDFDVAMTQEFTVDHSVLVPLHYLRPAGDLPLLPVFVNGLVPPLPTGRRCFALGRAVRDAVTDWPDDLRVAVVASGSFSLEVGGPRVDPNSIFGVPAPEWAEQVTAWLAAGDLDALLAAATRARMAAAGNVGGELLNWIAMLAAVGADTPAALELQPQYGHGFGFWAAS
jgi:Catalytic LigB subunit of aromatic ring-opening dioxygenase